MSAAEDVLRLIAPIRNRIKNPDGWHSSPQTDEALDALDALVALVDRYRDARTNSDLLVEAIERFLDKGGGGGLHELIKDYWRDRGVLEGEPE